MCCVIYTQCLRVDRSLHRQGPKTEIQAGVLVTGSQEYSTFSIQYLIVSWTYINFAVCDGNRVWWTSRFGIELIGASKSNSKTLHVHICQSEQRKKLNKLTTWYFTSSQDGYLTSQNAEPEIVCPGSLLLLLVRSCSEESPMQRSSLFLKRPVNNYEWPFVTLWNNFVVPLWKFYYFNCTVHFIGIKSL